MSVLREILAKFGFQIDDKKLEDAQKKADSFAQNLRDLTENLIGGDVKDAFRDFVSELQEQGNALSRASAKLGIHSDTLQQWRVAAETAGASTEDLDKAFQTLQVNVTNAIDSLAETDSVTALLEAAAKGTDTLNKSFAELGVSMLDANGQIRAAPDIMRDLAVGLSKVTDPARRTQLAMAILGEEGAKLLPLFADGEEGLNEALGLLDEFGGGLSAELLPMLQQYTADMQKMNLATMSLKSSLGLALFPALITITSGFARVVGWLTKLAKGTEIVRVAGLTLAAVFLNAQRAAVASALKAAMAWAPTVLLFTALVLLLDDLWTALKGGDSVLTTFIDKLFGDGTGKAIFAQIREDWDALSKRLDKLPGLGDKVEEVFSTIGGSVAKALLDDIPEAWALFWETTNKEFAYGGKGFADFLEWWTWNEVLRPLGRWFQKGASLVVDGLVQGLKDGWEKVKKGFTDLGEDLQDAFVDQWKIRSPSQVMYRLTTFVPQGAVRALADWAPKVRDQALDTFAPMLPASPTFAPVIRIPSLPQGQQAANVTKRVDMNNRFTIEVNGNGGVREGVRQGMNLAFDDERRAMLAALESTA